MSEIGVNGNLERLTTLLSRLDQWNAMPPEQQQTELRAGGGIVLGGEDMAALLDVLLGVVRRVG